MTTTEVAEAMGSIVQAHGLLRDFHREVVSFYELVDAIVAEKDAPSLEAEDPKNIVRDGSFTLKTSGDWMPRWFGRFYYETALWPEADDTAEDVPPTNEQLRAAFVFVAAAANDDELLDFKTPECVFGIAHVGRDAKVKSFIDAARYGIWNLDMRKVVGRDWVEAKTPEKTGRFGTGGFYVARRQPLLEIAGDADIRQLITAPLKAKYVERFGQPNA